MMMEEKKEESSTSDENTTNKWVKDAADTLQLAWRPAAG